MGDDHQVQLILDAIHTLRADLSARLDAQADRMDKQDEARGKQWEAINAVSNRICPVERHTDIDKRVRSLELDRAKLAGIVVAVSAIASLMGWGLERILK